VALIQCDWCVFTGREIWVCTVTEGRTCKDVEKSTIYRPRREALEGANIVGTLTSDLPFPELSKEISAG